MVTVWGKEPSLQWLWDLPGALDVPWRAARSLVSSVAHGSRAQAPKWAPLHCPVCCIWHSHSSPGESEGFKDMTVVLEVFLKWNPFKSSPSLNALSAIPFSGILFENIPLKSFLKRLVLAELCTTVCKLERIWGGKRKGGLGEKVNRKKNSRPSTWGHFLNNIEWRKDSGILLCHNRPMKTLDSLCSLSAVPPDVAFFSGCDSERDPFQF